MQQTVLIVEVGLFEDDPILILKIHMGLSVLALRN